MDYADKVRLGICQWCKNPVWNGMTHCAKHVIIIRERQRLRLGYKRRNKKYKSYRIKIKI